MIIPDTIRVNKNLIETLNCRHKWIIFNQKIICEYCKASRLD